MNETYFEKSLVRNASVQTSMQHNVLDPRPGFAIAFDLDGVLKKGDTLLPGAAETLGRVRGTGLVPNVPHIFVTNGTGLTEVQMAANLQRLFRQPIIPDQVILSSTPMQELTERFGQQRLLLVAQHSAISKSIAAHYGWRNVVTVQEYAARNPQLMPDRKYREDLSASSVPEPPIAAIILLDDPEDWHEGLQVCLDVLRTDGSLGPRHEVKRQEVLLFAGNPDFEYANVHYKPRITLGAFRMCLETIYRESTGRELEVVLYGKPHRRTFLYAERALERMAGRPLSTIYFIGDNPEADIRGANAAGERFFSILVRTGVFSDPSLDNSPSYPAKKVVDDVAAAIDFIFAREAHKLGVRDIRQPL